MKKEEKLLIMWLFSAISLSICFSTLLNASFPLFTIIWLGVIILVVLRKKDAGRVGFIRIPLKEFIKVSLINLGITTIIFALFEPWSHTYQTLLRLIVESTSQDITFIWLSRFSSPMSWLAMFIFSFFVTMFAEEIFFRGWLFQTFNRKTGSTWAIIIQAILFMLPNALVVIFMPILQGVIYTVVYVGVAIGVVGGWSAKRTNSIWPSLVSATVINLIMVMVLY